MIITKTLQEYKSIREFAYLNIKNNILNLQLIPNQKISELELVDILKIGKTPIREALILLAKEGLIVIAPQRGSFIAPINFSHVEEGREVRSILEENIHLQAINIMTKDDIFACEMIIKKHALLPPDPITEHWNYDEIFHQEIYKICNKERTFHSIQLMNIDYNRIRILALVDLPKSQQIIEDHFTIIEAIAKKDVDLLKEITHKHLNQLSLEKESLISRHPTYFINK